MPPRNKTPEAALGLPSDEYLNACGSLQVPYLSLSWKETKSLGIIGSLGNDAFAELMFTMLRRRLPSLTQEQFEENCGPADFVPWINAVQAGPGDTGKRVSPDWGRIFVRLSLENPGVDWYDTPLDRVQFAIEELTAQEERATWRAFISFRDVKLEDAMKVGRPDWSSREDGSRAAGAPYPVMPSVARGLDQAVALGLLHGDPWVVWPVNAQQDTLCRMWERIAARL